MKITRPFHKLTRNCLISATLLFIPIARAGVTNPIAGDPIAIDSGQVAGTKLPSGVHAYLGIPYAAPPVNELRWHAPVALKPWQGIYQANEARPACVQKIPQSRAFNVPAPVEPVSEDCLFLNVWTPSTAKSGAQLPVIVFIHGGGFTSESPNRADYSGQEIARKGVIYVSIGYRLGIFGYLAHPEMSQESGHNASGNWGVMDQIAALQWVQRNIAAFGGDARNVTIVGHSAGSESVFTLQSSPLAKGLFAKISGWSGADLSPGGRPPRLLAEAERDGVRLQEALKAKDLAEMRTMAWDRVLAATSQFSGGGPGGGLQSRPVVDGYVMPEMPETLFAQGKQNAVPMLLSSTNGDLGSSQEFAQVKTLEDFHKAAQSYFGSASGDFLKLFAASTDAEAVQQAQIVVANQGFGVANRDWARAEAKSSKLPVYLVQFRLKRPYRQGVEWIGPTPADRGAFHGSDIALWLGTYSLGGALSNTLLWTDADKTLSANMEDALVAFATKGAPNTEALKFPRYEVSDEQRLILAEPTYLEKMDTEKIEFLRTHQQERPQPRAEPAR